MEILIFKKNLSPVEIMDKLWNMLFDPAQYPTMGEYLNWLSHSLWTFNGISLIIPNAGIEEQCASVVEQLEKVGYIKLEG